VLVTYTRQISLGFIAAMALCFVSIEATRPLSAAEPGLSATGTWSGELTVGGVAQTITVQLQRRDDGSILGYVLGGTSGRTITGGSQSGSDLTFDLEIADPLLARTITISATVGAASLVGEADDSGVITPIDWDAVKFKLLERRFLFAELDGGGDPGPPVEVSVVQRKGSGDFVNGAFVSQTTCDLFACGGAVTDFEETVDNLGTETIDIQLATGGGCPGTGSLQAQFDPVTKFYAGSFSFTDCTAPPSDNGNLIGAKTTRTTSADAEEVLDTYAQLADALESEVSLAPSDVPLSEDYLHLGATRADRLGEFNADIATYDDIGVEFSRFRNLHTVDEPDALPELGVLLFGVDFTDRRSGELGGAPTVYRDIDTASGADELKFLNLESSKWLIYGNQVIHDLPLADYVVGSEHVILPTAGGDIFVSLGPWGAHNGPHTGHIEGNAKADWIGLYAHSLDQMVELAGNGNGDCEAGETCGLAEADILAGIVDYVAPAGPFNVTDVRLERLDPAGVYFGTDEHWRVRGHVAYYSYDFVHLREISSDLRDAMLVAGYDDPWAEDLPTDNLITGAPVVLGAGDTIARPQTVAEAVPGHPGFYRGKFGVPESPSQQMEFFTSNRNSGFQESFYTWLAPDLEDALAAALETEGLNPLSFRYHQPFLTERRWRAEMALSNRDRMSLDDYASVFSALGGWWENTAAACDGMVAICDQLFSIFPIRKDTAFYDAALYETAAVSYLAIHAYSDDNPPTQYGEVVDPAEPDPIADSLIVKWRDFGGTVTGYQGVAYRLDVPGRTLRIAWGAIAATEGAVVSPAIPENTDLCDGASVTCHNHDRPES
jgi:hypothetical protein